MPANQLKVLGIEYWAIGALDAGVTIATVLGSDIDTRPLADRIEWLANNLEFPDGVEAEDVLRSIAAAAEDTIPKFLKRARTDVWKRFLRRLVGAAAYDRLVSAVYADTAVVVAAVQVAVRVIQPLALAIDNCAATLSPEQITKLGPFGNGDPTTSVLRTFLSLDSALTQLVDMEFDLSAFDGDTDEVKDVRADDAILDELVETARLALSGEIRAMLSSVNDLLRRKLSGAVTAIESSDDGVSQAANSLIELIDRLLRKAFTDAEVLEWLEATGRTSKDLVFEDGNGKIRPTKRAQALCFVYGANVSEPSPFHEVVAHSLVEVRTKLQKLKHAESNTPDEVSALRTMMDTVEGALSFAIRIGWMSLGLGTVDKLRERLEAA
ncbi:hypothetical protein [Rhodococcus sp. C3V]|uniref:hypothetical protein n=1 Tax=Rhodococcus sp. C3V TaxID=3034165 RepID=UPI0023E21FB7|nr:hypothetical protein [Rhodococcus sp. C3V]MDF3319898.1 hypothetical protein [Rhodococcus sp. C3V]